MGIQAKIAIFQPPIFESILSEEAKEKLNEIQSNKDLTWQERRQQIDAILDEVPPSEISKLPLPKGFEKLPNGVYDMIKVFTQKQTNIFAIIGSSRRRLVKMVGKTSKSSGNIEIRIV